MQRDEFVILCLLVASANGCSAPRDGRVSRANERPAAERSSAEDRLSERSPLDSAAREIIERTQSRFEKVAFLKPSFRAASTIEETFAPLIVVEWDSDDVRGIAATNGEVGHAGDESNRPSGLARLSGITLFAGSRPVTFNGENCMEIRYSWRIPVDLEEDAGNASDVELTVVVGPDGFPLAWEASPWPTGHRVLFVSQSLEEAAVERFGGPLPRRRFAVEWGMDHTPEVIVAGVLEDGPVPMGPYVYLDSGSPAMIVTIHCRCSPSRFNQAVRTFDYKLESVDPPDSSAGRPLDQVLRLPNY